MHEPATFFCAGGYRMPASRAHAFGGPSVSLIPIPAVHAHPEVEGVLRALARGESDSATALRSLLAVVANYLPSGAGDGDATYLGILIANLTDGMDAATERAAFDRHREKWDDGESPIPDDVSQALAVVNLALCTFLRTGDKEVGRGYDILLENGLGSRAFGDAWRSRRAASPNAE
jgi:hypothetical protein